MYCTKCGSRLALDAATCPNCGALVQHALKIPSRSAARRLIIWSAVALLSLGGIFIVTERAGFWSGVHSSPIASENLADSSISAPPHTLDAPTGNSPISDMLLLPQADAGFVGSWGGYVYAQTNPQQAVQPVMTKVPMSYFFAERDGVIFLKTQVYGDPKWPVVKDSVKVINSKSIDFELDSICSSCTPPVRQEQITRLTLNNGALEADSTTYSYASGDGHDQLEYKGTLHPLNQQQLDALNHEVEKDGTFLKSIKSNVPVP